MGSPMHESRTQSEDSICLGLDPSCAEMGYPGWKAYRVYLGWPRMSTGILRRGRLRVVVLERTGESTEQPWARTTARGSMAANVDFQERARDPMSTRQRV